MKRWPWMQRLDGAAANLVRRLPGFLLLLLLLAGAWRLAGWGWRFVPAPPAEPRLVQGADGAQGVVARHWFGKTPIEAPAPSVAGEEAKAAPLADDLKLLGVIAGGQRSAAMLMVGKTAYDVLIGEEFANGLRLKSVGPDAVVIIRDGREERVVLPTSPAATAAAGDPSKPANAANPASVAQATQGKKRPDGPNGSKAPTAPNTPNTPNTPTAPNRSRYPANPGPPPRADLSAKSPPGQPGAVNPLPARAPAQSNPTSNRAIRP